MNFEAWSFACISSLRHSQVLRYRLEIHPPAVVDVAEAATQAA